MKANDQQLNRRPSLSLYGLILLSLIVFISAGGLRQVYGNLYALQAGREAYIEERLRSDHETWSEIVRYARNLNRFFIHHRGFDGTNHASVVTQDDIAEDVAFLTNTLIFELTEAINRFMNSVYDEGEGPPGTPEAQEFFSVDIAELAPLYIGTIGYRWQVRLSERVANFLAIQSYLEVTQEFVYFLHDGVLDETFTNIETDDMERFLAHEVYAVIELSEIRDTFNGIPLNEGFARGSISGFIALPMVQPMDSIVTWSVLRADMSWQNNVGAARDIMNIYIALTLGTSLITAVIILKVLLPNLSGAWRGVIWGAELYSKLPLLLKMILAIYALTFMARVAASPLADHPGLEYLVPLYLAAITILFSAVLLINAFGGKYQFLEELEVRIVKKTLSGFGIVRSLSPVFLPVVWASIVLISAGSLLFGLYVLYIISVSPTDSALLVFLCIGLLGVSVASVIILMTFITYAESYYYIKIIAEGKPVEIPEQKGIFGKPLNAISGLSHGLQASLEEQLQAERTKTELITSVSHDLKTPLTSIINYVDLLKKSNIEDNTAREYVEVLENKSERLKILIEDLFEAAKLTSGSMELKLEPVDISQLLTQAIGELSDKFAIKDIDIRYKPSEDKLIAMLDGQRMWRVFENLLNNVANYSPPASRAYISAEMQDGEAEIIMKNVSLYALDIDPNELFERFKRGDSARTTEGSGLGLSIAKDIVELHGGKAEISIDGDLFKVTIRLKLV